MMRELMVKKQELKDTLMQGAGKGINPINQEQIQLVMDGVTKSNMRIDELEN